MKTFSHNVIAWAIWCFLSFVWGSSFILIKKGLVHLSPTEVAIVRIAVAFIAFLPFMLLRKKTISKAQWKILALIGIFGNGLPAVLYATAQTKVLSASAGILNALTPIFTLILAVLIFRKKIGRSQTIGTVIGFLGASLLFLNDWQATSLNPYVFLIVFATICYGMSVNLVGYRIEGLPPLTIASCSFVLIGPLSFIGAGTVEPQVWLNGIDSVFYVVLLALFSTFIASILFYRLVHLSDPLFASSVSYVAPVVALLWGLLDGEALGMRHLVALALILTGVFLIRYKK